MWRTRRKFQLKTSFAWDLGPDLLCFLDWGCACPCCENEYPGLLFSDNEEDPRAEDLFCIFCRADDDLTDAMYERHHFDMSALASKQKCPPIPHQILKGFLKDWFEQWQAKIERLQGKPPMDLIQSCRSYLGQLTLLC